MGYLVYVTSKFMLYCSPNTEPTEFFLIWCILSNHERIDENSLMCMGKIGYWWECMSKLFGHSKRLKTKIKIFRSFFTYPVHWGREHMHCWKTSPPKSHCSSWYFIEIDLKDEQYLHFSSRTSPKNGDVFKRKIPIKTHLTD